MAIEDGVTTELFDIRPDADRSNPNNIININGTAYFRANDGSNGYELWKSDGTDEGTTLVGNINPGNNSFPTAMTNVNGTLFFLANDGSNGYELWKSDGGTNEAPHSSKISCPGGGWGPDI
ncbi:MAG: hypothetical protein R3C05_19925 [Pirellulaceae bacterium]